MALNQGQCKAKKAIEEFLISPTQKFMSLNAPAGFGKTYLLNNIVEDLAQVQAQRKKLGMDSISKFTFAASTNKAATLLDDAGTIHRTFGFGVYNDFNTGQVKLSTGKAEHRHGEFIAIDEASMIDGLLMKAIDEYSPDCKILLIGDDCQLAPVGSAKIPAFESGFPTVSLDEPMRQGKDSHLYQTCLALRDSVKGLGNAKIKEGEGIVRIKDKMEFLCQITDAFENGEDARVLTFTNKAAISYNNYVREYLGRPAYPVKGDKVVTRNYAYDVNKKEAIGVEETHDIEDITDFHEPKLLLDIPYRLCKFPGNVHPFRVPLNMDDVKQAMNDAKHRKDWPLFFELSEGFIDVRAGYAITTHTSQGSTYDRVFIDLKDMLESCRNLDTLRRLMYVAFTRARKEVVVFGI